MAPEATRRFLLGAIAGAEAFDLALPFSRGERRRRPASRRKDPTQRRSA